MAMAVVGLFAVLLAPAPTRSELASPIGPPGSQLPASAPLATGQPGTPSAVAALRAATASATDHPVPLIRLHGTWREQGRQYGTVASEAIRGFHRLLVADLAMLRLIEGPDDLDRAAREALARWPLRVRALLEGMTETSGMRLLDLVAVNLLYDLLADRYGFQCTVIAAWGDRTVDGALRIGRNFDFHPAFHRYSRFLTVVVFDPDETGRAVAALTHAGQISGLQAMNDRGLALCDNDGSHCGDPGRDRHRPSFFLGNLLHLVDHDRLDGLVSALSGQRVAYPLIVCAASPEAATLLEMDTRTVRSLCPENLVLATNHFQHPDWPAFARDVEDDPIQSGLRLTNLRGALLSGDPAADGGATATATASEPADATRLPLPAEARPKTEALLDTEALMTALDRPIASGGVRFPDRTVYQWLAVPERLEWFVRVAGAASWTRIDLAPAFVR